MAARGSQSEYAPFSDVQSLHVNDRRSFVSAVRKREDVAWNKLLGGRVRLTDLDLLDAPLRLACAVDEVLTVAIRPGDRAQVRVAGAIAKLARVAADRGFAFVLPLAIGKHIDHRIVREAGLQTLLESTLPVAFYEDLPYASWPEAPEQLAAAPATTGFGLQPTFAARAAPDVEAAVERKRRMAECYDSQIDSGTAVQIAAFSARYGGRERLWASVAWRNSELHAPEQGEAEA